MAKSLKRTGIVFLVIVISLLLITGCLFANNNLSTDKNSNSQNQNSGLVANEGVARAGSTYELSGTNTEMATQWAQATLYAEAHKGTNVTVKLMNDWKAPTTGNHYFGTGQGFGNESHSIMVQNGVTMTIDLNGHTIDRGLTKASPVVLGRVITVGQASTLTIKDSSYNSATAKMTATKDLSKLPYGKITGGSSNEINSNDRLGGGISLRDHSTLNLYGGIITGNYCHGNGGGIFVLDNSTFNYYDGIVCDNFSDDNGSGVYIRNDSIFNFYDGIIAGNKSYRSGGLRGYNSTLNIYGGSIHENVSGVHGNAMTDAAHAAGIALVTTHLNLYGGTIRNNLNEGGGVAGILMEDNKCTIAVSNNPMVYSNYNGNEQESNLYIPKNFKIRVDGKLEKDGNIARIFINFTKDNVLTAFTYGYSYNGNKGADPSLYFFPSNRKIGNPANFSAKMKNDEVIFDYPHDAMYDFIYLDEDGKRQNYIDNDLLHGFNDTNISTYALGNILPNTSINEFVKHLSVFNIDKNNMGIFDSQDNLVYDSGSPMGGITSEQMNNGYALAVGTGWYIKYNNPLTNNTETVYLSVLGDVNGDGRISASDCAYLRLIANDKDLFYSLKTEVKLASLIINNGKVTSADSEIALNVICKNIKIDFFY